LSFSAWKKEEEIHARRFFNTKILCSIPSPLFLADQGTS
jgi:hypothetical protein